MKYCARLVAFDRARGRPETIEGVGINHGAWLKHAWSCINGRWARTELIDVSITGMEARVRGLRQKQKKISIWKETRVVSTQTEDNVVGRTGAGDWPGFLSNIGSSACSRFDDGRLLAIPMLKLIFSNYPIYLKHERKETVTFFNHCNIDLNALSIPRAFVIVSFWIIDGWPNRMRWLRFLDDYVDRDPIID